MDKKNKIFFIVFFGAIFLSVFATWYKYFISRNYFIQAETMCDPEKEACFVYECSLEEDEDCPEDEAERVNYYKLIRKKAYLIPPCDPNDENCPPLACSPDEECEEILCSEETVEEGTACNDPEEYLNEKIEAEEEAAALEEEQGEEDGEVAEEEGSMLELEEDAEQGAGETGDLKEKKEVVPDKATLEEVPGGLKTQ